MRCDNDTQKLQGQYDRYFKITAERCDSLEWNGEKLCVEPENRTIERHIYQDLFETMPDFL